MADGPSHWPEPLVLRSPLTQRMTLYLLLLSVEKNKIDLIVVHQNGGCSTTIVDICMMLFGVACTNTLPVNIVTHIIRTIALAPKRNQSSRQHETRNIALSAKHTDF